MERVLVTLPFSPLWVNTTPPTLIFSMATPNLLGSSFQFNFNSTLPGPSVINLFPSPENLALFVESSIENVELMSFPSPSLILTDLLSRLTVNPPVPSTSFESSAPTLIVFFTSPFLSLNAVCFHLSPATLMSPTASPFLFGSSFHSNCRVTSPLPLTTSSRFPSLLPLNLAVTPGDVDKILNSASLSF